jgi:hypothetical protein
MAKQSKVESAENLAILKELVTKISIEYKTEEVNHALNSVTHSIEMVESELGKFILSIEKINAIEEAKKLN